MKILLFTPKLFEQGGVANYYATLKTYLSKNFCFVHKTSKTGNSIFIKLFCSLFDFFRMFFLIALGHYDAVYLNPSLGASAVKRDMIYFIMAKLFGKKTIVFWHGWDYPYQEKLEKSKFLKLFKKTFCKADLTFVLASEFKNKLIEWGNHNKIELMTTCYDNGLENGEPDYDLNNKIPLLFISRVERAKGVFIALESFKILENKFPDRFSLTIAGDGSALAEAKRYAVENQLKVDFPGYIRGEDKKACYYKHFFFFCTSYGEGLPCALLEAMACGLVPIIRPVGGIPDIFEDGKMGIMSESLEPEFYAEKIIELISDMPNLRQISEFNREYAKNNFSASKVANKIQTIVIRSMA